MSKVGTHGGERRGAGNPGYGKMSSVLKKVKVFHPLWWTEWEAMMTGEDVVNKKFAMTEFNKLQVKMIPQDITTGGEKLPPPIYGGLSIQGHPRDEEDLPTEEESEGDLRRDVSE